MEKKRFVGLIVLLIAAALIFSSIMMLRAASSREIAKSHAETTAGVDIQPAGVFPISAKTVSLTVFASPPEDSVDLPTNQFTAYLQKKLNIRFTFKTAAPAVRNQKKLMLLAGGDYPEVFLNGDFTPEEQIQYGTLGILRPLNDLIERYGDEIKKIFAKNPELQKAITAPNGRIYALPTVNECLHCWYSQKLWINTKWLDRLGLNVPKTTEELYQVLKAFKTQDPNGNGKQDEIPLTGAYDSWHSRVTGFLMSAFIYNTDSDYFYMKNGKVGLAAAQPEWRKGLEYINRLFTEGLIDPASFTQTVDGLVQSANGTDDNRIGSLTAGHIGMAFSTRIGENRHKEYTTIPPLIGPNGYQAAGYFKTVENGQFAITNKAQETKAVAAIRLADYLYSEEAALFNEWGPENINWRKALPGEVDEHGRQAKYHLNTGIWDHDGQNDRWKQMGILYRNRDYRESWSVSQGPLSDDGYEHRLFMETITKYEGKEPKELFPLHLFMEPADAIEASQLKAQINDYIESNMVQFITGSKSIDKEWNLYLKGFQGLKLDRYLEIYQHAYEVYTKNS